ITLQSDCFGNSILVDGGLVMKLMDNCAGILAARWCKGGIVTIGIDAINFHRPCRAGEILHAYARLIFTSSRSIETLILSFAERKEPVLKNSKGNTTASNNSNNGDNSTATTSTLELNQVKNPGIARRLELLCSAFYTFVAVDLETKKAKEVPQFIPVTEIEKVLFNEGKKRYEDRKLPSSDKKKVK
ncbi:cytosolic acyl coenzyme A thioester hydrolase isoform 3, partial [Reticulomyxa filosa]